MKVKKAFSEWRGSCCAPRDAVRAHARVRPRPPPPCTHVSPTHKRTHACTHPRTTAPTHTRPPPSCVLPPACGARVVCAWVGGDAWVGGGEHGRALAGTGVHGVACLEAYLREPLLEIVLDFLLEWSQPKSRSGPSNLGFSAGNCG